MIFRQTHFEPTTACITGQASVAWVDHWFQVGWEQDPVPYNSGKKCKDRIWGDPMNLSGRNICNYVHKYIYIIIMYYYYCWLYIYICVYNHANTHQIYDHSNICNTWAGRKQLATILKQPWPSWWTIRQSVLGPLDKLCVYIYDHIYDHYILL